jgi:hypothetical protein
MKFVCDRVPNAVNAVQCSPPGPHASGRDGLSEAASSALRSSVLEPEIVRYALMKDLQFLRLATTSFDVLARGLHGKALQVASTRVSSMSLWRRCSGARARRIDVCGAAFCRATGSAASRIVVRGTRTNCAATRVVHANVGLNIAPPPAAGESTRGVGIAVCVTR